MQDKYFEHKIKKHRTALRSHLGNTQVKELFISDIANALLTIMFYFETSDYRNQIRGWIVFEILITLMFYSEVALLWLEEIWVWNMEVDGRG